jgi:predicted nucleic acid-binding protein
VGRSRAFIDTNILGYMFDPRDPAKQERAKVAVTGFIPGDLVLSTQVLQEFYWTATRKLDPPMAPEAAAGVVADLARNPVVVLTPTIILEAVARGVNDQIAFWDALIVEAALAAGCDRLLTEDLQHGRMFETLRVENPLLP